MKFLTIKQLCEKLSLSRSTVYNKNNPNGTFHDPSFPKPRRLSARCVRWEEGEVNAWMQHPNMTAERGVACASV